MKRQIFLYLFVFALLLVIFMYMNQKSIYEFQQNEIEILQNKIGMMKDSIPALNEKLDELNYFTLQGNENAMVYLEDMGYNVAELENHISEWIYDQNLVSENNPLVPFEGMQGGMKINKIKFLNHKWILADFTDGMHWGEVILEYTMTPDGEIDINTLGSLIYPQ